MPSQINRSKKVKTSRRTAGRFKNFRSGFNVSMTTAALFALVFGGIGGYMIRGSHAATDGCVYNVYSTGLQHQYVHCVQDLQYVLDNWHATTTYGHHINQDGYYGSDTKSEVVQFQKFAKISQDGVAGNNTWLWLCDAASFDHFQYDDVGCTVKWKGIMKCPYNPQTGVSKKC